MQNEKIVVWETRDFDQIILLEVILESEIEQIITKLKAQGAQRVEVLHAY